MELNIFTGFEYLLSHEQLARESLRRPKLTTNNQNNFRRDYTDGRINQYHNSFVAYQQGILCGQSKDGAGLFDCAREYYGSSNLTVFLVPVTVSDLNNCIENRLEE